MELSAALAIGALFLVIGAVIGYFGRRTLSNKRQQEVEEKLKREVADAETKAKEIVVEAREKAASILVEIKNEEKERRKEIEALEARVLHREEQLDKKLTEVSASEEKVRTREDLLKEREASAAQKEGEIDKRLEKVGSLSMADAKEEIVRRAREDRAQDLAQAIQKIDRENREEVEKRAGEIITIALQRYARGHVAEMTTTMFQLADEELKGKIIGREGRNIRALERATGVEFIMDDAPDGIIISSFDPFRREVARMALEKLVKDGRIQPAKIEEEVEKAKDGSREAHAGDRRGCRAGSRRIRPSEGTASADRPPPLPHELSARTCSSTRPRWHTSPK